MPRPQDQGRRARRAGLSAAALLCAVAAGPAAALDAARASDPQETRPDKVFVVNRGDVAPVFGKLVESGLEQVVVEVDGKPRSFPGDKVARIELGSVPETFAEGRTLFAASEYAEAAALFQAAAGDADASAPVRAAARLRAAESLLALGAADASAFATAAEEAARLVADHPQSRDVPAARMLRARALRLAGDGAAAAAEFAALFAEANGATASAGYDLVECYEAALLGAHSALAAGDTLQARELFTAVDGAAPRAASELEPTDPRARRLAQLGAEAKLGEGFVLLASGKAAEAATFFDGAARQGAAGGLAYLGLGEAQLAQNAHRPAQLAFARYGATGLGTPDSFARALVGLAEATYALPDANSRDRARAYLGAAATRYPTTPAAVRARELLGSLF